MFYRNLTSVRYLAAQSATLIPVPYENTLRQFMAQRLTLQRNNVEIFTQDLQHPGIQPTTPSPNHLDISRLSWTTLPQSAKNVNKLKPSRKRNQWYVHICFHKSNKSFSMKHFISRLFALLLWNFSSPLTVAWVTTGHWCAIHVNVLQVTSEYLQAPSVAERGTQSRPVLSIINDD